MWRASDYGMWKNLYEDFNWQRTLFQNWFSWTGKADVWLPLFSSYCSCLHGGKSPPLWDFRSPCLPDELFSYRTSFPLFPPSGSLAITSSLHGKFKNWSLLPPFWTARKCNTSDKFLVTQWNNISPEDIKYIFCTIEKGRQLWLISMAAIAGGWEETSGGCRNQPAATVCSKHWAKGPASGSGLEATATAGQAAGGGVEASRAQSSLMDNETLQKQTWLGVCGWHSQAKYFRSSSHQTLFKSLNIWN